MVLWYLLENFLPINYYQGLFFLLPFSLICQTSRTLVGGPICSMNRVEQLDLL